MDLNFAPPAEVTDLAQRVADFVKAKVVPYEKDPRWTAHGPTEELAPRAERAGPRRRRVRAAGVNRVGRPGRPAREAACSRRPAIRSWARRRSIARRPTRATSTCWTRSPRRSSTSAACGRWPRRDPLLLLDDRAGPRRGLGPVGAPDHGRRDGNDWVIDGASGSSPAPRGRLRDHHGRTGEDGAARRRCSSSTGQPGHRIVRMMKPDRIRRRPRRGRLRGLPRADDAVLGELGKGFRYAQVRLGAGRLTHCMRWTGRPRARTTSPPAMRSGAKCSARSW